jgi:hypothetical protein
MKIINNFPKLTKLDNIENELTNKAPIDHSSASTTYGTGSSVEYGHVKLSDSYTASDGTADSGIAASSKAVADAYTEINSNLTSLNSRFKTYFYSSDIYDTMKLTTDTLEDGLYLMLIQESASKTNRSIPSFAIVYINNGMWINWQKTTDTKISSITYSSGKITLTMSQNKFLFVCMINLGS